MMAWEMIPAWTGKIQQGCLNCEPVKQIADLEMIIAIGFGSAMVTKDDQVIWMENYKTEKFYPLKVFERIASRDPDHDWRVILEGPLRGRTYQRHNDKEWVLIDSNQGFA